MIEKIGPVLSYGKRQNVNQTQKTQTTQQMPANVPTKDISEYYKILNQVSFRGEKTNNKVLTDLEKSFIKKEEIRIPNILDLDEDINISLREMPKGTEHLNSAGLNIHKTKNGTKEVYTITNDKGNKIFEGKFRRNGSPLPQIIYKQGKYMPEITVKDESLSGKAIKMYAGSELEGENFSLKMPGTCYPYPGTKQKISFKGQTVITTLNKEPRTVDAVDKYFNSGLQSESVEGDYKQTVTENNPVVIIPAGGFGERFKNISRENENKPSTKMPTDDRYRLIATALNLAASAGILQGNDDSLIYLSQNHEIQGENIKEVEKYRTDGGAIAEGLKRDIIPNDKDAIILNGDIFTNADISRAYNALKTLPNAALVIPYYPVNPQRAKSFGLLGVENDKDGNLLLKSFVEKPKYTSDAPVPSDFGPGGEYDKAMQEWKKVQTAKDPQNDNVYLANPGMYFMTSKASKVLTSMGVLEPTSTGLGGNVMPKIVELINEGKLLDEDGNELKAYTVPLEAKGGKPAVWEDLGTAEAFLSLIRDVAAQVDKHGLSSKNKYYGMPEFVLNDFKNNVDLKTGIVYDSDKAKSSLDAFKKEYNIENVRGNIYIAGV